jgi:hypothetical protein
MPKMMSVAGNLVCTLLRCPAGEQKVTLVVDHVEIIGWGISINCIIFNVIPVNSR